MNCRNEKFLECFDIDDAEGFFCVRVLFEEDGSSRESLLLAVAQDGDRQKAP
jgi:hypothetical protein